MVAFGVFSDARPADQILVNIRIATDRAITPVNNKLYATVYMPITLIFDTRWSLMVGVIFLVFAGMLLKQSAVK